MSTILLVDDDADLVEACGMALEQRGHQVKTAGSAAEAREVLAAGPADALVLDVMMETRSAGFDLAREVHERSPDLPILMLTSVHEAVPPSLRFGPDATWLPVVKFLEKPVDPSALADEIGRLLGQ